MLNYHGKLYINGLICELLLWWLVIYIINGRTICYSSGIIAIADDSVECYYLNNNSKHKN